MRFTADGPSIPDDLLNRRDQGLVVFLCGAGISIPSGMPTFVCLTKHVLDTLKAPVDAPASQAFRPWLEDQVAESARTPLDQIFNTLQQGYGRDHIGQIVAERLTIPDGAELSIREHKIVARLSSDLTGAPQIVTTNFDLLFERPEVTTDLKRYEPPTFPDLHYDRPVSGITYLHGRLKTDSGGNHDYVLSSADFGRAYLAEGWATRFVLMLLEKYTVVLLGYQADDPPVKYLLQGLNSAARLDKGRLFAFDRGRPEDIEAKWRDRGVTPISYGGDKTHSALWDSLEAWADRADDPVAWQSSVIDMARRGPKALQPHERGQVAHIVRTNLGAKLFAEADPSPPAEWLCVFDSTCRMAKPAKNYDEDAEEFDPLTHYGFDDDPPRASEEGPKKGPTPDDLISWRPGDGRPTDQFRLSGRTVRGFEAMPPRLSHLSRWIGTKASDPVVAWWAAKQAGLHPRLSEMISNRIEEADEIPELGHRVWNLLLEHLDQDDFGPGDMEWYRTRKRIKREGWTTSTLRAFARSTEPYIKVDRPYGVKEAKPPSQGWGELSQDDIGRFSVSFPGRRGEKIEIPDEALLAAFSIISRNLVRGTERLGEVGTRWFRTATLYPDDEGAGNRYISDSDRYILWFVELLDRMADQSPEYTASSIALWPAEAAFILDKIRLYAWNKPKLFDSADVARKLLSLAQDVFWNPEHRRELLFLLRDRWDEFSSDDRTRLERRLLNGRNQYKHEEDEDYPVSRAAESARILGWLVQQDRTVSDDAAKELQRLKASVPDWHEAWATHEARSLESRGGAVEVVTDAAALVEVPVSQIVRLALENTRHNYAELKEYRPFSGLVKDHPVKALAALGVAARNGEHPEELWRSLINDWPDEAPLRATRLFCERLRRLPTPVIHELRHYVGSWMRDKLPGIAEHDEAFALTIFDDLIGKIIVAGAEASESSLGDTLVGGERVERSRRTIDHAINAPIGHATQALISILIARKLPKGHGMPEEFSTRLERLLAAPGEGSDHAVCLLTRQLGWLNYIAPKWVESRMLPWFNPDHPAAEPAWNGMLYADHLPTSELFETLKPHFLHLFPKMYEWHWEDGAEQRAHEWIVIACIRHLDEPRYLTFDETLACMRDLSASGRTDAIHFLGRIGKENEDGWTKSVIPFLRNAWPQEAKYQIESSSSAFLSMIDDTGDDFPVVMEAVRRFLRPIHQDHHSIYRFHRAIGDDEEPLTNKFPGETLDLMDLITPDDPRYVSYNLGEVLNLIAEVRPELTRDRRFIRLQGFVAAR